MIKYRQLIKSKSQARKNLWYISGNSPALITDAFEVAKSHAYGGVESVCLGVFFPNDTEELKDFINRPYYEERKLVVVHDVSKISGFASLVDLKDSSTFYIVVDYDRAVCHEDLSALLTNNQKARAVDCSFPTDEDLLLLVNSRLEIDASAAKQLVAAANGDEEWLLNKVTLLETLDMPAISNKVVRLLTTDKGAGNFEDSLLQFDKQACFLYIMSMGPSDINSMKIASDLHNLSLLQLAMGQYSKQVRPITDTTGLSKKQVDHYIKNAAMYDSATSKNCFNLLMRLYSNLRSGDRLAYFALVCGW